ncbi:hypothetical protein GCM10027436_66610 [Actinophytocola sediminis]
MAARGRRRRRPDRRGALILRISRFQKLSFPESLTEQTDRTERNGKTQSANAASSRPQVEIGIQIGVQIGIVDEQGDVHAVVEVELGQDGRDAESEGTRCVR